MRWMEDIPQKERVYYVGKVLKEYKNLYHVAEELDVRPDDLRAECFELTRNLTRVEPNDLDRARSLIESWSRDKDREFHMMLRREGYYGKDEQDKALQDEQDKALQEEKEDL